MCSYDTTKYAVSFHLSPGNNHDALKGRKLISTIFSRNNQYLLADRAYEYDETRTLAKCQGFIHVVSPKKNRKHPWKYDSELYKQRNKVERIFLRLKRFRRVFTRYDKLDLIYISFIFLAFIFDSLLM